MLWSGPGPAADGRLLKCSTITRSTTNVGSWRPPGRRFGRGPSGRAPPAHQGPLDGLRAAAAGAVLLTHVGGLTGYTLTGTPASWVLSRGDVGVPIFFSLSGLLLYRRWATAALTGGRTGAVAVYLRRRALRILPAYWAVVLIALPVLNPGAARHAWPWIQYLLLIQNYDSHPWWSGTGATGLAQAWSLVVEVSFYLILPFLAAALTWFACRGTSGGDVGRRARRLLFGIAALAASSVGWEVLGYYPRPSLWSEGTPAAPADLVLHRDGHGCRAGLGRGRAGARRHRRLRWPRRHSRHRQH